MIVICVVIPPKMSTPELPKQFNQSEPQAVCDVTGCKQPLLCSAWERGQVNTVPNLAFHFLARRDLSHEYS